MVLCGPGNAHRCSALIDSKYSKQKLSSRQSAIYNAVSRRERLQNWVEQKKHTHIDEMRSSMSVHLGPRQTAHSNPADQLPVGLLSTSLAESDLRFSNGYSSAPFELAGAAKAFSRIQHKRKN